MERFEENFRGNRATVSCSLCGTHPDSQEGAFNECNFFKQLFNLEGNYQDIFEENVPIEVTKSISKISRFKQQ